MNNNDFIYIQNGTNASTLSFDATNKVLSFPDQSTGGITLPTFSVMPLIPVSSPEPVSDRFFSELHKAYAALPPDDRHELDIWDATLADGLDEE